MISHFNVITFPIAKLQFAGYRRFTRKGAIICSTIQSVRGSNEILVNNIKGLFTWRWGPQVGEVKYGWSPHLSYKRDQIKMRDYMDRRVTPPKRVTSPIM